MTNISKIDKNFEVKSSVNESGLKFYNVLSSPFRVYGVFYEDGKFRRIPEAVAKEVSRGVYALHANTAGGRVRFSTDSARISIRAKMSGVGKMSHFALCGSAGFDLYADDEYRASFIPPFDMTDGYESTVNLGEAKSRSITINFPLYSNVDELYIGVDEGSALQEHPEYRSELPIVYYGSSITQGGCASRPGTSYQSFISRHLNLDFINLGFSGGARAEKAISEYIQSLPMLAFVYDYDNNAPTVEDLTNTHERMFKEIRQANPELPIVMMSMPKFTLSNVEVERYEIIKKTYDNAVSRGDKNVYLIDGRDLMQYAMNDGTVDNCHPNDIGFFSMAKTIIPVLEEILK